MPVADYLADKSGVELYRLSQLYEFPDFVKTAKTKLTFNPPRNSPAADPRAGQQQFFCHTKAATWLSCLFFEEKQAEFHPKDRRQIRARLDHYTNFWGIKHAVDHMRQQHASRNKQAEQQLPDSSYAFVLTMDDGTKHRSMPLRSTEEVKAAAEWLSKYRSHMPFSYRNKIATRILEKAAAFGASLGNYTEFVERQAGRGVCDPAEVVQMIVNRSRLAKTAEHRAKILDLAEAVRTQPAVTLSPSRLVKLAEVVDDIDRHLGIAEKYTSGLPAPEDVLFSATFSKAASDIAEHVATTSGKVYEKNAFGRLSVSDIRSLFGDDFADRVSNHGLEIDPEKMADEVATLPRPDAELLDGLLADSGISPSLHKAASVRQGFTPDDWGALAQQYASPLPAPAAAAGR